MNIKLFFISVIIIFGFYSCTPKRDCVHYFQYSGRLIISDSIDSEQLKICLGDIGPIVSNVNSGNQYSDLFFDTATASSNEIYTLKGSFLGECINEKERFQWNDTTKYIIIYKDSIIQKGSIGLNRLKIDFIDSLRLTVINMPDIKVK